MRHFIKSTLATSMVFAVSLTMLQGHALAASDDASPEAILARDFSEKMEISYAGPFVEDGFDYTHGNEYNAWWADTFNIEWEPTSLSFENWDERVNTWINAEDLPDWTIWNFNAGDAVNYVDQGLLKQLPEDWREKYPNLAKASEYSPANAHYEEALGGMYVMFRPLYGAYFPADVVTPQCSVFLRKDWAEEAGYDLSKNEESNSITISEWIDYMQAVKDAGLVEYPFYVAPLEFNLAISSVADHTGNEASMVFYLGEDGKYHWGPEEEETGIAATVEAFHDAYEKGLMYPEFYTLEPNEGEDHFAISGDAATYFNRTVPNVEDQLAVKMKENLGLEFWDVTDVFVLTDDNGVFHGDPQLNYWTASIISPDISDEKLDRLLTYWDYSCTDEGMRRAKLGVEGLDWEMTEDGEIISHIQEEGKILTEKYRGVFPINNGTVVVGTDYDYQDPAVSDLTKEKVAGTFITKAKLYKERDNEPNWDILGYSSKVYNIATYDYDAEYARLVAAGGDFNENYETFLSEKEKVIHTALDDLNANLTE